MERRSKIGLTLIIIGSLIFFVGYTMLSEFREREEDINRVHPEETITEHGGILALNFCGGVFLLAGIIIIILKMFDIEFKDREENL